MDFPVEATVHLDMFPNKAEVTKILRSHNFELSDLRGNQVRVKGSFLQLRAAKASLEQLHLQTNTYTPPSSSSPSASGAISKQVNNTNGARGRSESRNQPLRASPSSPTATSPVASGSSKHGPFSPGYRNSSPSRPDQRGSFRPGKESFSIDVDVYEYADKLRKKDIDSILVNHNVIMQVSDVTEESCSVTLMGKGAKTAVGKLQGLMEDLSKSLRTQEVLLKDMDREGQALWESIQSRGHICDSVLVSQKNDRLHLIGSSRGSYELKQRLLGTSVEHGGRSGRTLDKNSRQRSTSLPPSNRRNTDRDKGANTNQSPVGAAGYSWMEHQDDKRHQKPREPAGAARFSLRGMFRGRSKSESRKKNPARMDQWSCT
ncbi:uncharacterized protein si:dkey-154b15.1 [Notolabrus celidotus]|uniref:uncharacterized protein si:dkey-154b15.1 n=1 Tax=Notolabrus celidotus TaxID=1203425 RepID=UPI0014901C72|nr:uncharacterized protein si:dkey-154b15.1 [Notolabrus celidotus]